MNVAGFVGVTDEELILHAMRDAQLLLAEHIERGPTTLRRRSVSFWKFSTVRT